jgi:hypothetical protein
MIQTELMLRPDVGSLIRGSGGLRKIRWKLPGIGKRGALRIIYYWDPPDTIEFKKKFSGPSSAFMMT